MQLLHAHRRSAPELVTNDRVDAVCSDEHIDHGVLVVAELEQNVVAAITESRHLVPDLQDSLRQRFEHPIVEAWTQQADEAAAVFVDHVLR